MATAFSTFDQYASQAYEGQLADRSLADIVFRAASGSDIDAGLAVVDTDERSAALVTGSLVPTGIQIRIFADENKNLDNPDAFTAEGHEMSVARVGRVWVRTVDGAAVGDPVYVVPGDSTLTNTDNTDANTLFPNATFKTAAAAGELALVQLNGND